MSWQKGVLYIKYNHTKNKQKVQTYKFFPESSLEENDWTQAGYKVRCKQLWSKDTGISS